MSETLKPCPFCGGKARRQTEFMSDGYEYVAVACSKCGAMTPGNYSPYGDQAEWNWNSRVDRTFHNDLKDADCVGVLPIPYFKCSSCGGIFTTTCQFDYCPSCGAKVVDK